MRKITMLMAFLILITVILIGCSSEKKNIRDRQGDDYDMIAARFNKNVDVNEIKDDIEKRLRKVRDVGEGDEDFSVETPGSILETVNSTILAVQIFVYIIAGISLLVGGIGIMNTMYTSVLERTREIGIMKAIGSRNKQILNIFVIESGILGLIGGIVGIILGYGISKMGQFIARAYGLTFLKPYFPLWLTIGCLLFAFLVGAGSGLLPAIQASRQKPVDALRYE